MLQNQSETYGVFFGRKSMFATLNIKMYCFVVKLIEIKFSIFLIFFDVISKFFRSFFDFFFDVLSFYIMSFLYFCFSMFCRSMFCHRPSHPDTLK